MTWRDRARTWLREPLFHFLVAGALVFALLSGRAPDPGERRIVVNEAVVGRLIDRWTMTYRRPPSASEIDGLIREFVKDQVYYREALRLGLDRDDEVVIRRMRQKLASTATAETESRAASDAELQAWIERNPARYAPEARVSFRQAYLGPASEQTRQVAAAALAQLRAGRSVDRFVQPAPIGERFAALPVSEIDAQFGDGFAAALRKQTIGSWAGPLESGLGLHLVLVERAEAPRPARLADVRQMVENDWRAAAIARSEEDGYRELLAGYDVVIERPR